MVDTKGFASSNASDTPSATAHGADFLSPGFAFGSTATASALTSCHQVEHHPAARKDHKCPHLSTIDSSVSKNPGNDTATHSLPAISVSPSAINAATANAIAIL